MRALHQCLIAGLFLSLANCGSPTTVSGTGTVTNVGPLQLQCPTSITLSGVTGGGALVPYPAPTSSGGAPPVQVTCSNASGSSFSLGATAVKCSASDSAGRAAACEFAVTLSPLQLAAMKFLAFGDSITAGENGIKVGGAEILYLDPAHAYPTFLQALLTNAFVGQNLVVIADGVPGETSADGKSRLPGSLAANAPDVLLLLEGINGLTSPQAVAVANDLRDDIRLARARGVKFVFVSTLLPPVGNPDLDDAVRQTNALIASIAPLEGAVLVDAYAAFVGQLAIFMTPNDSLHPTPAGNQALANAFFAKIQSTIPTLSAAVLRR